jgi:perosamine synthetase
MRVLDTNQLFAADEVRAFETEYASYAGSQYARGLGNATQGLHLALAALDIGVNDEVIVPPFTWISTASCVLMQNAVPVFADCEPNTLALSADTIREKLTPRTKAIIVVHMFGYPADMNPIVELASEFGLRLIEDASHAHGASYHGRQMGTFGDAGVFSLHQRKSLCVGDGGILITNSLDIDQKVHRLRSFGDVELSYNYRMTELAAAIGRVRLRRLDDDNAIRIRNAESLSDKLTGIDGIQVRMPITDSVGVFYRALLEYDPDFFGKPIADFVDGLKRAGIPAEKTWEPLHRHPHFNPTEPPARGCPWDWPLRDPDHPDRIPYREQSFPVIEDYCDHRILELPVHPPLNDTHMQQAAEAIMKVCAELGS